MKGMSTGLRLSDADHASLIEAWESAIEPFADLAESLTEEQWHADSGLPGWTNADVVAHVIGIERDLLILTKDHHIGNIDRLWQRDRDGR